MAIMDPGVANQKFAGGGFGLIETPGVDQVDDSIGILVQLVGFVQRCLESSHVGTVLGALCLNLCALDRQGNVLCGLIMCHAAVLVFFAAGAGAGIVSTGLWHGGLLYQECTANTPLDASACAGCARFEAA